MYILKNAITSIIRNKGRNILIGIIILVISSTLCVTLAISNSSTKLIDSYNSKYEVEATIGINRDNMMKEFTRDEGVNPKENMRSLFEESSNISVDDIKNYATSNYVKDYYYIQTVGVNSNDLEVATLEQENIDDSRGMMGNRMEEGRNEKRGFTNSTTGDFTLMGYSSIKAMNEFLEGKYKVTSGEVPTDFTEDSCLINTELASLNNLNVNDEITLVDPLDSEKNYSLKISGIFTEELDSNNQMNLFSNSVNTIITNTNILSTMKTSNTELSIETKPTFILKNSEVVDKFESEAREKGLNENLAIEQNLDIVENSTKSISNVKTFATTFLIITLIIAPTVLLIINMINIRERKYEIGVLRTIGMKKVEVALQFLTELLIVSSFFLIIGASIGSVLSVPISNKLLEQEIASSEEEANNIQNNFGQGRNENKGMKEFNAGIKGVAKIEAFQSIDATVDLKVIIELIGLSLVITLISCTSTLVSIERFSPLTILKERT